MVTFTVDIWWINVIYSLVFQYPNLHVIIRKIYFTNICPFLIKIYNTTKIFLWCECLLTLKSPPVEDLILILVMWLHYWTFLEVQWEEVTSLHVALKRILRFLASSAFSLSLFPGFHIRSFLKLYILSWCIESLLH